MSIVKRAGTFLAVAVVAVGLAALSTGEPEFGRAAFAAGRGGGGGGGGNSADYGAAGKGDGAETASSAAKARAANLLGNLNAAHASPTARQNAAATSMVGRIATYEQQMRAALEIQDPAARVLAITAAREQLAKSANKDLTSTSIAEVDQLLGINGASPELGTVAAR